MFHFEKRQAWIVAPGGPLRSCTSQVVSRMFHLLNAPLVHHMMIIMTTMRSQRNESPPPAGLRALFVLARARRSAPRTIRVMRCWSRRREGEPIHSCSQSCGVNDNLHLGRNQQKRAERDMLPYSCCLTWDFGTGLFPMRRIRSRW